MEDATLSGWAFKQGSKVKNWKKRFFVLRGRALSYYASLPTKGEGDEKGRVIVVGVELDAPNAMLLVTCERKAQLLKLKPVAPEDAPLWLAALQRAAGVSSVTSPVGSARPQVMLKRDASVNAANLFGTDLHDDRGGGDYQPTQQPAETVAAYYKTAQPPRKQLPQQQQTTVPTRSSPFVDSTLAVFDNQTTTEYEYDGHGGSFDFGDDDDSGLSRRSVDGGTLAQGNHIGVVREGWLTVGEPRDPRSWKKRYAVLAGPTLTYFASKGSGDAIASVWVSSVSLSSSRANALDLALDSGRALGVAADSREELMLWERAFAKALGTSVLLRAASSKDDIDHQIELDFGDPGAGGGGRPSSYTGVFHEGWLLLKHGFGKHEWQKRYFVLNGATLQERESPTSKALYESYVVHMTVQNDSSAAEFELELMSGRSLRLQAENTVDAEAWIHALADLVGTPAVKSTATAPVPTQQAQHTAQLPTPVIRPPVNLPPRKLKKTGWLMKEGGLIKSWKKRYFILDGDVLHYFDKVDGGLLGGGIVFRVVHNSATANSLDVHFVNGRILRISAETRADIDAWFEVLRAAADTPVHKVLPSYGQSTQTVQEDPSHDNCQRGWLLKRGQMMKTWKRRYFVIQRNRLTYYNTIGGELLGSGAVFDVTGGNQRPLSLDVRFQNGRLLHVAAADDEDFQQWHDALKSASNISESVLSHSSLSQEELPFGKDFDYDIQDEGAENDMGDMFDAFDAEEEEEQDTGYGMWEAAMNNKPGLSRENSWDSDLSETEDHGNDSDGVSKELRRADSDTPSIPDEQQRACSGWLRKQGELVKNWKRRYFTLHGATLKYFKSASGSLLRSYEVTQVEESPSTKFGFTVVMKGGRRLVVAAESTEDYEKWMLALWGVLADQRASLAAAQVGGDESRYSAVGVISVKSVPTSPVGSAPAKFATAPAPVSSSHSGWLEKEGQRFKTWKRRYFTVKNGQLMYFSDMGGEMQGHSTVHGVIVDKTKPNTLRILLAKDRVLRVTAATADEMTAWFQVLSATQKPQNSKSPRGSDVGDDFSDIASSVGSAADRRSLGSAPLSPVAKPQPPQPPGRSRFDEGDYLKNDTITNESFLRIRGPGDELSLTSGSFYKPRSFKGDLAFAPTLTAPTEEDSTTTLTRVDSEDDLEYLRGSNVDHDKMEKLRKMKEDEVLIMPQKCAACCIVM